MEIKIIIAFTILCVIVYPTVGKIDRVICYLGSWSNYRNGNGKFTPEDIDPQLCTHIIYTFLGIETNGTLRILDTWLEIDLKNLERFNALKLINPNLKTLIAVGGWNEGSIKYSAMAADPAKRAALIESAINILEKYGFDGFDLDWEYPAQRGGSSSDKINFAILLKEFREEFDKKSYLLTAAVAAPAKSVDMSYDVPALSKYLDSINVMAYDLHGAYDGATGANAPLFPSIADITRSAKALTVDAAIRGWISRGADPHKISMGIPMYGRTFTLSNPNTRGIGAPSNSGGNPGPYTQETGMLGYLEICEKQKQEHWTVVWDDNTKTPYAFKEKQWVSYDNQRSIKMKVEHAESLKLGGVMVWSLETEDFRGICGEKYPLLNSIKNVLLTLDNGASSTNRTQEDTPLPEQTSRPQPNPEPDNSIKKPHHDTDKTENKSNEQQVCKKPGLVRDPKNCSAFYSCVPTASSLQAVRSLCAGGLVFDSKIGNCNYKYLVDCSVNV